MPRRGIPERWLDYKPCGQVIEGTRIICFKVPLKSSVSNPATQWTVKSVLQEIPNLSAVIDLTNTKRYYDPEDLISAGVKHTKIFMEGRIVPPESKVHEFITTMDNYLANDEHSLVGVHCTHGLNRTGYMVCQYMRDRLGMPAHEAIKRFEVARGHAMERKNLIGHLLAYPRELRSGAETTSAPTRSERRRAQFLAKNL